MAGMVAGNSGEFVCPVRWRHVFTPLEFEEIVAMFQSLDEDDSGELSITEIQKMLLKLDLRHDGEYASTLLSTIDADGSGLISFDEFCDLIGRIKGGDGHFRELSALAEIMNDTPASRLQTEARLRGLKITYQVVEEREPSAYHPSRVFVMEVRLEGDFRESGAVPTPGEESSIAGSSVSSLSSKSTQIVIPSTPGLRRYQAMGKTTREARLAVAAIALQKLEAMMPGLGFPAGELPREWHRWAIDNADRGVEVPRILRVLLSKGFRPARCTPLMHLLLATASLDRTTQDRRDRGVEVPVHVPLPPNHPAPEMPSYVFAWLRRSSRAGIDANVLIDVLSSAGFRPSSAIVQELRRGGYRDADCPLLDFWLCCYMGMAPEVELYLTAGQDPNEESLFAPIGCVCTPLSIAAASGHVHVLDSLVACGANVDLVDRQGRTALHAAAIAGQPGSCRQLLEWGAKQFAADSSLNTPLHLAARAGSASVCELLAFHGEESVRNILHDRVPGASPVLVAQLVQEEFQGTMSAHLARNERQCFMKEWCLETAERVKMRIAEKHRHLLPGLSQELMSLVLDRFDPDPDSGTWILKSPDNPIWLSTVGEPAHLQTIIFHAFRLGICHLRNNQGRTPLHEACWENRCDSHAEAVQVLCDWHHSDLGLRDSQGCQPIELLIRPRHRIGSPTGSKEREELIVEQRSMRLEVIYDEAQEEEAAQESSKRQATWDDCSMLFSSAPLGLWAAARDASAQRRQIGDWAEYEDPDTGNFFYHCVGEVDDDVENGVSAIIPISTGSGPHLPSPASNLTKRFQWRPPQAFVDAEIDRLAVMSVLWRTIFIRQHSGRINVLYDPVSGSEVWLDTRTEELLLNCPLEATWSDIDAAGPRLLGKFGRQQQWQELATDDGNTFYRREMGTPSDSLSINVIKKKGGSRPLEEVDFRWEKPVDAVEHVDLVLGEFQRCSREVTGMGSGMQPWHMCLDCDEEYRKSSTGNGEETMFKVCVVCAKVCHKGMRGHKTHPCKASAIRCMCCELGKGRCVFYGSPKEVEAADAFLVTSAADEQRAVKGLNALRAAYEHILAYVPPVDPDGGVRNIRGWHVCRVDQSQGRDSSGWIRVYDPQFSGVLPVNATVHPKQGAHSMKSAAGLAVFWSEGRVVRRMSQNWYAVEIISSNGARHELHVMVDQLIVPETNTFFFHPKLKKCTWNPPDDAGQAVFCCGYPILSAHEWKSMHHLAPLQRRLGPVLQYLERESGSKFYFDSAAAQKEEAVLRIQAAFRRKKCRPYPVCREYLSTAYSWELPSSALERSSALTIWAYMRRRSTLVRILKDRDDDTWEELQDKCTGLNFFFCPELVKFTWDPPEMAEKERNLLSNKLLLSAGERVFYSFGAREEPVVCHVTRVRHDSNDRDNPVKYDVEELMDGGEAGRVSKWVKRAALSRVPKSAEELELDEKEVQWRKELIVTKKRRDLAILEQVERTSAAERLRRRGPIGSFLRRQIKALAAIPDESKRKLRIRREKQLREEAELLEAKTVQRITQLMQASRTRGLSMEELMLSSGGGGVPSLPLLGNSTPAPAAEAFDKILELQGGRRRIEMDKQNTFQASTKLISRAEAELSAKEDGMSSPRSLRRRRVVRLVHMCMVRQAYGFVACEWGCRDWVRLGRDKHFHEAELCIKRVVSCSLGCSLQMRQEEWLAPSSADPTVPQQQYHEEIECCRRLVPCSLDCGEYVAAEEELYHRTEICIKRPTPSLPCRLGCGADFEGGLHRVLEAEEERLEHEAEECELRAVKCANCGELVRAKNRRAHRALHVMWNGVTHLGLPGTYKYEVPDSCCRLKVQVWGGGGGSGHTKRGGENSAGHGGGAAYVEAIIHVIPGETLIVNVGEGGAAGVYGGTKAVPVGTKSTTGVQDFELEDDHGVAQGGIPGGGEGHGGNSVWAAGGGGGYSAINRLSGIDRLEPVVVAAGGGGGGSRPGVPGGGLNGELPGTKVDKRCGRMGTATSGGAAGDSGDVVGCRFPATPGQPWQGGDGGQFGGGGGGGFYGGGGGGGAPGIAGGGGGGASYVRPESMVDCIVEGGKDRMPGGLKRKPPRALGATEGEVVGGFCGEGGISDPLSLLPGNSGAVILYKPGFYDADIESAIAKSYAE